jgi:S1-C subfamily serine protease
VELEKATLVEVKDGTGQVATNNFTFKPYGTNNGANKDLAVAQKSAPFGRSYKPAIPELYEEIWVVGWTLDGQWHVSHGHVDPLQPPYTGPEYEGCLCHTASTSPALSGAAVMNNKGNVVGIHKGGAGEKAPRNVFIPFTKQHLVDFGMQGLHHPH